MLRSSTQRHARKIPHLHRDRLGSYYVRVTSGGRTIKRSLKKRGDEPTAAEVIEAFESGDSRQFDVVLPNGTQINNINSDVDAKRAKRFIEDMSHNRIIEPHLRPLRPEYAHLFKPLIIKIKRFFWQVAHRVSLRCLPGPIGVRVPRADAAKKHLPE